MRRDFDVFEPQVGSPSRRRFLAASAGLAAAGFGAGTLSAATDAAESTPKNSTSFLKPNQTILFQGDSITDSGRKRDEEIANSQTAFGNGYAWLAAATILVGHPDDSLKVFNRGISGDKVVQLADRWQSDSLDLKPDILSILVGANDYGQARDHQYDGTAEKYHADYRALLERTRAAIPNVQVVICEPFLLHCGKIDESWFPPFRAYQAAAEALATEFNARFVPFQTMFDAASHVAPPERWSADGVHPTFDGAALMAHWWLKAVGD